MKKYNDYVAQTTGGIVPVKVIGDYWRMGGMDNWIQTFIGLVEFQWKRINLKQVIFFDIDGTMFWAGGINPYVSRVDFAFRRSLLESRPKLTYQNSAMV